MLMEREMRARRPTQPYRAVAFGPSHASRNASGRAFVVAIASQPDDDEEQPWDPSSIPTITDEEITAWEEIEKRQEVEQILAMQASVLETAGRRKIVTAATVAFGLGVAATLLIRRQPKDPWS
jgi:hypothetical protein